MNKTVADLKAELADLPDDAIVIMSSDSEGNRFTPWAGDHSVAVWQGHEKHEWIGEVIHSDDDDDDDDEVDRSGVPCVVLWPLN